MTWATPLTCGHPADEFSPSLECPAEPSARLSSARRSKKFSCKSRNGTPLREQPAQLVLPSGRRGQLQNLVAILSATSGERRLPVPRFRWVRISGQLGAAGARHRRPRRPAGAGLGAALRLCGEPEPFAIPKRTSVWRKLQARPLPHFWLCEESRPEKHGCLSSFSMELRSIRAGGSWSPILFQTREDKPEDKQSGSRVPLYSAAFDFFEMTSTGCQNYPTQGSNPDCPAARSGPNDVPTLQGRP